jgi:hypothetical protein
MNYFSGIAKFQFISPGMGTLLALAAAFSCNSGVVAKASEDASH